MKLRKWGILNKRCRLFIRFKNDGVNAHYLWYKSYQSEKAALDAARDLVHQYGWMDSKIKITESGHDSYFEIEK